MKLLTVKFEEAMDIAPLSVGTSVTVAAGTVSLTGAVMAVTYMEDPLEPALVPHVHPATIGPAVI